MLSGVTFAADAIGADNAINSVKRYLLIIFFIIVTKNSETIYFELKIFVCLRKSRIIMLINKLIRSKIGSNLFLGGIALFGGVANAAGTAVAKDFKTELLQIFDQALSIAGAFTVAGFITGCWAVFKIIVLILNHQEDARNNKLSGIPFFLVAGGLGFGFAWSAGMVGGTVWGSGSTNESGIDHSSVFKVNSGTR